MLYLMHTDDGTYLVSTDEHLAHFGFKSKKGKLSSLLGSVKKGHKYILRVETGKKFPRYRYFYTQDEVDAYNNQKKLQGNLGAPITDIRDEKYGDRYAEELAKAKTDHENELDYIEENRSTRINSRVGDHALDRDSYRDKMESIDKAFFMTKKMKSDAKRKLSLEYRNEILFNYRRGISTINRTADDQVTAENDAYKRKTDSAQKLYNEERLFGQKLDAIQGSMKKASRFVQSYIDVPTKVAKLKFDYERQNAQHEILVNDKTATENDFERKVTIPVTSGFKLEPSFESMHTSENRPSTTNTDGTTNVFVRKSSYDGILHSESTELVSKIKRIDTFEEYSDKNKNQELVNPNYGTDNVYSINCQNCTFAYAMRRKGYDVEARPNDDDYYGANFAASAVFNNVVTLEMTPSKTSNEATEKLIRQLSAYGDGSYGELGVRWYGYRSGHSLAWSVENGKVVIRDSQVGTIYKDAGIRNLMDMVDYTSETRTTCVTRLDTAIPNDNILNCVKERKR